MNSFYSTSVLMAIIEILEYDSHICPLGEIAVDIESSGIQDSYMFNLLISLPSEYKHQGYKIVHVSLILSNGQPLGVII